MFAPFHSARPGTAGWLLLALAVLAFDNPSGIQAQQRPKQSNERATPATPQATSPPAIEINVRASGTQIAPGDLGGARADITNKSAVSVYLRAGDVLFVFALETYQDGQKIFWCSCDSWFPNATREGGGAIEDPMKEVLYLKPGGTSTVFPTCSRSCGPVPWYREYRFINFVPGTYPVTVDAKYWENRNFADDEYHMRTVPPMRITPPPERSSYLARSWGLSCLRCFRYFAGQRQTRIARLAASWISQRLSASSSLFWLVRFS